MSLKETSRVWEYSKCKGSALLLLLAIADNANDRGYAYPGIDHLARKTRMSYRQVRRLVDQLDREGDIYTFRVRRSQSYLILCALNPDERSERLTWLQKHFPNAERIEVKMSPIESNGHGTNHAGIEDIFDTIEDMAMSPDPLEPLNQKINKEIQSIWEVSFGQLQLQMPKEAFDTWLRGARLVGYEADPEVLILGVMNGYAKGWLEERLKKVIVRTLSQIAGRPIDVKFVLVSQKTGEVLE